MQKIIIHLPPVGTRMSKVRADGSIKFGTIAVRGGAAKYGALVTRQVRRDDGGWESRDGWEPVPTESWLMRNPG